MTKNIESLILCNNFCKNHYFYISCNKNKSYEIFRSSKWGMKSAA